MGSLSCGQLSYLHDREQFPSQTDALKKKVPNITINNKQLANQNQKIVIIKPLVHSSKSIFSNPVKFTKAVMESPFNSDQIKEIRTHKQSQTNVAELIVPNQNLLNKLLSVNQIGEWPVECYIPMRDKFKYGVIYPVDLDKDLGKLKHDINIENGVQVAKIARKNGETLPSPTLKLAFNDNCLPVSINIVIFSYRVRPFVFNPLQCYKCQRIGHTASSCKAKQCCLRCDEVHSRDDCAAETLRCAGCKGEHRANSCECP